MRITSILVAELKEKHRGYRFAVVNCGILDIISVSKSGFGSYDTFHEIIVRDDGTVKTGRPNHLGGMPPDSAYVVLELAHPGSLDRLFDLVRLAISFSEGLKL